MHGSDGKTRLFTVNLPIADYAGLPGMEIDMRSTILRSSQSEIGVRAMSVVSDGADGFRAGSLTQRSDPITDLRPIATITAQASVVVESADAMFTVEAPSVMTDTTIVYQVSGYGADAADADDFDAFSSLPATATLALTEGSTRGTITLSFNDDVSEEQEEGFMVTLLTLRRTHTDDGCVPLAVQSSAASAIAQSDPVLNVEPIAAPTSRGENIAFTVNLSRPSDGAVRFEWEIDGDVASGDAVEAGDFDLDTDGMPDSGFPTGAVAIPLDQSSTTINVGTYDDPAVVEMTERYRVAITGAVAATIGTASFEQNLIDDSVPVLTLVSVPTEASEDTDALAIDIDFTPFSGRLAINFRVDAVTSGDSVDINDWANDGSRNCFGPTGMCTSTGGFYEDDDTVELNLSSFDDAMVEPPESFRVILLPGNGYVLGAITSRVGSFARSDREVFIEAPSPAAADEGTTLNFTVALTEQSADLAVLPLRVTYRVTGADGITDGDFVSGTLEGMVTLATGERSTTLPLVLRDDMEQEAAEDFTVTLISLNPRDHSRDRDNTNNLSRTSAMAAATINADDPWTLSVSASAPSASEDAAGTIVFTVSLLDDGAAPTDMRTTVNVAYALTGTADVGMDYSTPTSYVVRESSRESSGVVTISATGNSTATASITIRNDDETEGNETVTFELREVLAGSAFTELRDDGATRASVVIIDDDVDRRFYITTATESVSVAEGGTIMYRIGYDGLMPEGTTPVTVTWMVESEGTTMSASDADFVQPMGSVEFAADTPVSQTITIRIASDALNEGDETFAVSISEDDLASSVYTTSARVVTTITDDANDDLQISIARSDSGDLIEGASATFTVSVGNSTATAALTIALSVSGEVSADDYELPATVELAAGMSSATVVLEALDDNVNEGNENLFVELGSVQGARGVYSITGSASSASATIALNDPITVSVAREEGDTGGIESTGNTTATFVVTLSGGRATSETVIDWRVLASMEPRRASTDDFSFVSGDLSIPVGSTMGNIMVGVNDDDDVESAERYTLMLSGVRGGGRGVVTPSRSMSTVDAEIPASDPRDLSVTVRLTDTGERQSSVSVNEDSNDAVIFEVEYGDNTVNPPEEIIVRYSLSGDAEGGGIDYAYPEGYEDSSGTVTIDTNETTATVSLTLADDRRDEADESIVFELLEVTSGAGVSVLPPDTSATATIVDDDKLILTVSASADSVSEGAEDTITFTVSLEDASRAPLRQRTQDVRVAYTLFGTAGVGADYTAPAGYNTGVSSGVVTISATGNSTAAVSIMVRNDNDIESNETVTFGLSQISAGSDLAEFAETTTTSVVIIDDDVERNFYITAADMSVAEGETITYQIGYDGRQVLAGTTATVVWTVTGLDMGTTAASVGDLAQGQQVTGSVVFGAADLPGVAQEITIRTRSDALNEGNETFAVSISEDDLASGVYTTGARVVTTINDVDDELQISIVRSDSDDDFVEEGLSVSFTVSVGNATATAPLTIDLSVSGGVSTRDYTLTPATMTVELAEGVSQATVTLDVVDDNLNEANERLYVVLGSVQGARGEYSIIESASSASATIASNDEITVSLSKESDPGDAEGTSAAFVVTLSGGDATSETVITWRVLTSTAAVSASAEDFESVSGELRIPVGETTGGISLRISEDDAVEVAESYRLALRRIEGGGLGLVTFGVSTMVSAQILASDPLALSVAAVAPASVSEDAASVSFTVTYGGGVMPPEAVTVRYRLSGDAAGGRGEDNNRDYTYPAGYDTSGTTTIGTDASEATVTLAINNDRRDEADESIVFELLEVTAGGDVSTLAPNTSATATIVDDDKLILTVSASPASVSEDDEDTIAFTVSLSDASNANAPLRPRTTDVRVAYTLTGRATANEDYDAPAGYSESSGVVVLSADDTTAVVSITVRDDDASEGGETIVFGLREVLAGGDLAELTDTTRASVVIRDDDVARNFYIAAADTRVAEGRTITYQIGYDSIGDTPISVGTTVTVGWTVTFGMSTTRASVEDLAQMQQRTGSVEFVAGDPVMQSITIETASDTLNEGPETFAVSISEDDRMSGVYSTGMRVVTTITDDADDELQISIARSGSGDLMEALTEGSSASFTVSVGNATATALLTIPLSVSGGVSADDYTLSSATVELATGVSQATVVLDVVDDNLNEANERLYVVLGSVQGARGEYSIIESASSASATIASNDEITVSLSKESDPGDAEGTSAAFVVTLSGGDATSETVITWRVLTSTAAVSASAEDFESVSGELRIPVGETTGGISLRISEDDAVEVAESYRLALRRIEGGGLGSVTFGTSTMVSARILASDPLALSVAAVAPASVSEDAASVSFTVTYGGGVMPPEAVTVRYRLSGDAAGGRGEDNNRDYTYPVGYDTSGTTTIGTDASEATVTLAINNDRRDEADESIVFELLAVTAGGDVSTLAPNTSATATIVDDDKLILTVSASPASVSEGDEGTDEGTIEFTVLLADATGAPLRPRTTDVSVVYELMGTADVGMDYSGESSGVVVLSKDDTTATVSISVMDDMLSEGVETIVFELREVLAGNDLAELAAAGTIASVSINDDDVARNFYIEAADTRVEEGETITYQIGYDGSTVTAVTVEWMVTDLDMGTTPASVGDFARMRQVTGSVAFDANDPPGVAQEITIEIASDTLNEGPETFAVSISADDRMSGVYSTGMRVVTTITDDADDELQISIARSDSDDLMEGASATFTVSVGNATATADLTIPLSVSGGVSADDYNLMPETVVLAEGVSQETVVLDVLDDDLNEGDEIVRVALDSVQGARGAYEVTVSSASATIASNDEITVSLRKESDTDDAEGTGAAFVVTLSGGDATSETVIDWRVLTSMEPRHASTDDFASVSGELRIPVGETTGGISLRIEDDGAVEVAESYTLALRRIEGGGLGSVTFGTSTMVSARILASDPLALSVAAVAPASVPEDAASVSFRVEYGDNTVNPPEEITIRYRLSGSAAGGNDRDNDRDYDYPGGYDVSDNSGTAVIGTDVTSATVMLSLADDRRDETDESIVFELLEVTAGGDVSTLAPNTSATATIVDDDKLILTVSASADVVSESAEDTIAFTVLLSDASGAPLRPRTTEVRVAYELSGDASGEDVDYSDPDGYEASSGVVVLSADGSTVAVSITVVDDMLSEANETITFELREVLAGGDLAELRDADTTRASVVINDDDALQAAVARVGEESISEGAEGDATTLLFEISLTPDTVMLAADVTVTYAIGGDVTTDDYTDDTGGSVTIEAGSSTAQIMITLSGDDTVEDDEELAVVLQDAIGGNVSLSEDTSRASVTIVNDDSAGIVVDARVYLQGAYDAGSGNLRTSLIGLLPKRQPYEVAPWNYPATTTVPHVTGDIDLSGVTSTIVDWVLVELRSGANAAAAIAAGPTTGGRAAGLLLSDGRIAGINEAAPTVADALSLDGVRFEAELPQGEDVYVLIHHRNHLPVMSAQPATNTSAAGCSADYCVDFQAEQSYSQCEQLRLSGGEYAMYAGDVDRNFQVTLGDRSFILVANGDPATFAMRPGLGVTNYNADGDLDFVQGVTLADRAVILINNGRGSLACAP